MRERMKRFDPRNPDWHLLDILRGINLINLAISLPKDPEFNRQFHLVKLWTWANSESRQELSKERLKPQEFIEKSRERTQQLVGEKNGQDPTSS